MTIDPQRVLIERWFHDLFTNPNSAILEQFVTEDFVTRDPSGKVGAASPSAFLTWLQWYRSSFTDATWQMLDFLSSGDTVVVRYAGQTTYRGGLFQIPANDQCVTEMGILIFQLRDNRICTVWSALSDLELVLEMGAIPRFRQAPNNRFERRVDTRCRHKSVSCIKNVISACAPNQPLQRTRSAPRDRCYFRV